MQKSGEKSENRGNSKIKQRIVFLFNADEKQNREQKHPRQVCVINKHINRNRCKKSAACGFERINCGSYVFIGFKLFKKF